MSYMHCPNCGLSIHPRAPSLTLDRCPRCFARRSETIPMVVSEKRSWPAPTSDAPSATSGTTERSEDRNGEESSWSGDVANVL
jgi:Zn-finger nucleic acid-binding protein